MKSLQNFQELIIFDTETTGLNPHQNHIIELGVVRYSLVDGIYIQTEALDQLIQVGYPLPSEIVNLTGITDQELLQKGISEQEAVELFVSKFIQNSDHTKLFIAYNAPFDIQFVSVMLKRYGYDFPNNPQFLDLLTVYKDRASYPHKLKNAIEHYELTSEFKNSHRAIDDCIASFEVLRKMSSELDDINKYLNLFGYNPKYPVSNRVLGVTYKPQYYNARTKLYQTI